MSERIHEPPQSPSVTLVADRPHDPGSRGDRRCKDRVGILHGQRQSCRTSTERFRTVIQVSRRFIREPELGTSHGQSATTDPVSSVTRKISVALNAWR